MGVETFESPLDGRDFVAVQLSDLHVSIEPLHGELDTIALARATIAHVAALDPDVVVVTGDLVAHGEAEEYETCRAILDALSLPYYVLPGNHDRREALVAAFGAQTTPDGFVQYAVDDYAVRMVVLDTLCEGFDGGELDERRLAWLRDTLATERDRPTIVFMHHPPFVHGIEWVDSFGFAGAGEFADIIRGCPHVVRVACGHVHRPIQAALGSALVCVAPGNADHVRLDLRPGGRPAFVTDPRAVLVHALVGETLVTHTSYVRSAQTFEMAAEASADLGRRNLGSPLPRIEP